MDFSTIKNKMESKDGIDYKNVRETCADVRLIFKNAMKYNDERDDAHAMAKTLWAKFEEKWLQLLPKVDEEVKFLNYELIVRVYCLSGIGSVSTLATNTCLVLFLIL